jgi:long-chain acyl-CoA synthetase
MGMQTNLNPYSSKPWLIKYDLHVPGQLSYPGHSLVDLLLNACQRYPDMDCFSYKDVQLSYKEVEILTERIASGLVHLGIQPGDHVGIILPNIPQFGLVYFGILRAGAVVVAINPQYRPREIAGMISTGQVKAVIALDVKIPDLQQAVAETPINLIIQCKAPELSKLKAYQSAIAQEKKTVHLREPIDLFELICIGQSKINLPAITPEQPAVLQFTGGTTGTPKAAIGLHRNLVANTIQFITWCNLVSGQETVLAVIPLFDVYGMVLALCLGIKLGARIIFWDNPRELERLVREIEKQGITFFPAVPTLYQAINQQISDSRLSPNFHSLKACISGSAPLSPEIKNQFESLTGAKLMEGYGLSEAPTATHCNPLCGENRAGSIGLPLPDVECKVVNMDDDTCIVPIGESGELLIKGPQVMEAYFQNEVESSRTLKDGWLHTGDIVRMDQDGYFYIVDRKKSLIKVSGFQVWPNEVEQVLISHPSIKEAGVGGVPDPTRGEKVIAWVVLKDNVEKNEKEIRNWCKHNLAPYKIPSEIYFLQSLPRTTVGKILRRELIHEYLEQLK